jgi:S-DNA-T family DNA segregation ATPase FtsK/SpoIIIE
MKPTSSKSASKRLGVEVLSILMLGAAIFTVAALFTFNPKDPSWFMATSAKATNACGWVGAYLASLLFHAVGLSAFLVPAAFLFFAATLHQREGFGKFSGIFSGMTIAALALSVFVALQWQSWSFAGKEILTGGVFGAFVAQILLQPFNPLGASIVSMGVFAVALVLSTPVSVSRAVGVAIQWSAKIAYRSVMFTLTSVVYWLGIGLMKSAHGAANAMKSAVERSLERARALKTRHDAGPDEEPLEVGPPKSPEVTKPIRPVIPVQDEMDFLAQGSSLIPDFDDQEIHSAPLKPAPQKTDRVPAILPHEKSVQQKPQSLEPKKTTRAVKRGAWKLPTLEFLKKAPKIESAVDRDRLIENSNILKQKLADFGIEGDVTAVRPGPVITLYEFRPGPGIKVSRIQAVADDLSMALSAESVRILAPIPGKSVVGIEIPSDQREKVFLREFLQNPEFYAEKYSLPVAMGKDIAGTPVFSDLARMPHLLCAGQTGAGKSVFMNNLICSLFYRFTPDELRMILVDPKFIEFRAYQDVPHLLLPVVDDPKNASTALKWAVREMERRYRILAKVGAKNLAGYNQKVEEMGADTINDLLQSEEEGETTPSTGSDWITSFEPDESGAPRVGRLPYIVVIIDELADLMMIAKKEVEISIARIAQKARAAGIHLIIATQRPSTDVITGLIKANLPSRVSFQLASYIDSKTILDRAGAERLLGQGDMLFIPPGNSQLLRLHGAYLDDDEIGKITAFLKDQGKPIYRDEILVDDEEEASENGDEDQDDLFDEAIQLVKHSGHASASYLQRHLKVGYNRAARMIETMEARGIVGPAEGARPREVLIR